ncbi:hypothetical protein [Photobacterium kishitanii]|uniref:hypothetical protein n=1 Tax=Photobacterium kishitanii TaxID=318456 RepID=UPI000D171877|nr:hypothetical protein [Photobacterium kishitanii]PSV14621.1 hypothetical protein C0W28_16640 [Photobacterium kishitanii]
MSNIQQIPLANILKTIASQHDERTDFHTLGEQAQRDVAVTTALELIRSYSNNSLTLNSHLQNLSRYADEIQNALKLNNN